MVAHLSKPFLACFLLAMAVTPAHPQSKPLNPCENATRDGELVPDESLRCNVANQVMVCRETAKGIFAIEPTLDKCDLLRPREQAPRKSAESEKRVVLGKLKPKKPKKSDAPSIIDRPEDVRDAPAEVRLVDSDCAARKQTFNNNNAAWVRRCPPETIQPLAIANRCNAELAALKREKAAIVRACGAK